MWFELGSWRSYLWNRVQICKNQIELVDGRSRYPVPVEEDDGCLIVEKRKRDNRIDHAKVRINFIATSPPLTLFQELVLFSDQFNSVPASKN